MLGGNEVDKLICPLCGASIAYTPLYATKGNLLSYRDGAGLATIRSDVVPLEMPASGSGVYQYGIAECQACAGCFIFDLRFRKAVYPIPQKVAPEEVPEPMKGQYEEASLCYAVGAYRASVSMCQRTLESLCQDRGVSGLNELRDKGVISVALFDRATEIRLWAGVTKHKALSEPITSEDANQLLTYLEMILHSVYVEPKRLDALQQKRKQLDKK